MCRIDIRAFIEMFNGEKFEQFRVYGTGSRNYTEKQKLYAISLIDLHGIRGTTRIVNIPRRTLQRWCRKYRFVAKRCPEWVYERAERWKRRKKRWRKFVAT